MTLDHFIAQLEQPLASLPRQLIMRPLPGPFDTRLTPPGSKSITNRALLMAALAQGESRISGALLDADDARVMIQALTQLGAGVTITDHHAGNLLVRGTGGRLTGNCTLQLNNAGTATRFLTAAVCLADAPVVIDGNERMRQRPIGQLVTMLRALGVPIEELGAPGCVPLRITPHTPQGGTLDVPTTLSSQFVSALILLAPHTARGITIRFTGPVTSPSYIQLTQRLMTQTFAPNPYEPKGSIESGEIFLPPAPGHACPRIEIEPDASGATYFWGAAAMRPGARTVIPGLDESSAQGDARFADLMATMGATVDASPSTGATSVVGPARLRAIDTDLSLMPDAAMTLASIACLAQGLTTIRGLRTLRVKETDRLAAMSAELAKLGVTAEVFAIPASVDAHGSARAADEGIRITPPPSGLDLSTEAAPVLFHTYDDHRMAMSLALIGLRRPNVTIDDPACVAKTYPTFWNDLARLYRSAHQR
jgi:3-phosphoshikimate 1-carboxyvinyltransferase